MVLHGFRVSACAGLGKLCHDTSEGRIQLLQGFAHRRRHHEGTEERWVAGGMAQHRAFKDYSISFIKFLSYQTIINQSFMIIYQFLGCFDHFYDF